MFRVCVNAQMHGQLEVTLAMKSLKKNTKLDRNWPEKIGRGKWSAKQFLNRGYLANCVPPVVFPICTAVGEIDSRPLLLINRTGWCPSSVTDQELHCDDYVLPLFFIKHQPVTP